MAVVGGSKHLTGFKESDHEILVKIVKGAQWRQIKGKKGEWKEFVAEVNKKKGGCLNDPAKHPVDVLTAFVQTFTKKEDIELVKRIRKWGKHRASEKLLNETQPWPKSPEQELVELTQLHPRFRVFYSFQSWNEGWKMTSRGEVDSPVRLVSLDCEMVVCEGEEKEVVRVCAVGSDCKTLLDELVVPSGKVKDYVTSITGVSAKDLEGVTLTQADAQKLVKKLLTPGTILVGHSLYHDLRALKIDHKRVIDTALLFRDPSWPVAYSPSLTNLCKSVLKYDFREEDKPHNCLEDAIIPMRLVKHWLEHGVSSLSLPLPQKEVNQETVSKLFLHKVPEYVTVPQIRSLFESSASCEIQDIVFKNRAKTGSTFAIFQSMEDADTAFEQLEGSLATDSYGYPQKAVMLMSKDGKFVRRAEFQVRKMANARTLIAPELESSGIPETPPVENPRKRLPENGTNDDAKRMRNDPKFTAVGDSGKKMVYAEDMDMGETESKREHTNGSLSQEPPAGVDAQSRDSRSTDLGEVNKGQTLVQAKSPGGDSKAGKTEQIGASPCSCTHFQELKDVKLELAKARKESKSRANEIKSLQKLVAALSRREGLA